MRTGIVYDIPTAPVKMFSLPSWGEWVNMDPLEQNFAATVALTLLPEQINLIRTWASVTFPEKSVAAYQVWHELHHRELGNPFDPELAAFLALTR